MEVLKPLATVAGAVTAGPVGAKVASASVGNGEHNSRRGDIGRYLWRHKILSFAMTTTLASAGLAAVERFTDVEHSLSADEGHSEIFSETVYLTEGCNGTFGSHTVGSKLVDSTKVVLPLAPDITFTKTKTGEFWTNTDMCVPSAAVKIDYNEKTEQGTVSVPGSAFFLKMYPTPGYLPKITEENNGPQAALEYFESSLDVQLRAISLGNWRLNNNNDPSSALDSMLWQIVTVGIANTCAQKAWDDMGTAYGQQLIAGLVDDPTRVWNQNGHHAQVSDFTFNPVGGMKFKSPYEDDLNARIESYKKAGFTIGQFTGATCEKTADVKVVTTTRVNPNATPAVTPSPEHS